MAAVIQASDVSNAIQTLLELSKPEVVMEGLISDDVLDDILQFLLCASSQHGNSAYVQLLLLVLEKSTSLGKLQSQTIKTLVQLIQTSKSQTQQKLLQVLATQKVSEEEFDDIEAEVLALARSINKSEDWHVKLEAMKFYSKALFPKCSKRLLTRKVDFIFPVVEKLTSSSSSASTELQQFQLHQLEYLLALSCTPSFADAVEHSIPETYLAALCFKSDLERVNMSKFLNFVLNLSKAAKGKAVLKENQKKLKPWLKPSLTGHTGVFGFLVYVSVFGANAANLEFNECLDKFTQTLEFISTELDSDASNAGGSGGTFTYTLEFAMESLLEILGTKPVGKVPEFCPGFIQGNLIGRIARVAYQQPSSLAFRRTVLDICYTLGCQTTNKDKLYECLEQEQVVALLQNDDEVDRDKRAEVLRWRPVDEDSNLKSLEMVTQCERETCKKILLEVDLGFAIQRYYMLKNMDPAKTPEHLGNALLDEVKSYKRVKMEGN